MNKTTLAALIASAVLAACGGGGGDAGAPIGGSCTVAQEQNLLRSYMNDWYFWTGSSPNPDPAGFATVPDYYEALKYTQYPLASGPGKEPWSFWQTTASFNQFFAEGQTMGYGIFVNGIEHQLPLRLRYTEANGPAALAGLKRGDQIVSINGRSAAQLIADDIATGTGFAALNPAKEGDTITLVVDSGNGPRTVTLAAATYALTPVPLPATVLTSPLGKKVGYFVLKDFITQSELPMANAFAAMRAAGATELILDLRYNGGGRVSTAQVLASLIAGGGQAKPFATLRFNARHQSSNAVIGFQSLTNNSFARVIVLTGSRTCSASELVVNGLKPVAGVVTIGGTTCGKPVGFNPTDVGCGNTYSAVTFESVNGDGVGGYFNGLAPTCTVADDFTGTLGSASEKLTAAGLAYIDNSAACPSAAPSTDKTAAAALRRRAQAGEAGEPGQRPGMWAD